MHRPGHYGASLLVYAPLGFVTLAAGLQQLALVGAVGAVLLAMLPDQDQRLAFLPGVKHRGVTHTVHFAALVGLVVGAAGVLVGLAAGPIAALGLGAFGFAVGTGTMVSHLLADSLTPAGVEPFRDGRHYSFDVARADSLLANYALLAVGVIAVAGAYIGGVALARML